MSKLFRKALEDELVDKPVENINSTDNEPDASSKKLDSEKELVIYGKIANFDELKKCKNIEHQEQYEIKIPLTDKNAIEGKIRIRMSVKDGKEPKYVITTKTKLPDGSSYEGDAKTTVENFIQFKYLCECGMIKDRYYFPVEGHPGLKWEVDVFTNSTGGLHEWCKIDLELDDDLSTIPPFPIELTDVITAQAGQRSKEEETIVRTLYDTVFRVPNPFKSQQ